MSILFVLLFIIIIKNVNSLHLNTNQIKMINNIIQQTQLPSERNKINLILFKAYEKWAIKKAIDFKKLHKYKCHNIKTDELVLASKIGLFKSIIKYNGKYDFINYSSIYVNSELLKIITEKYSLSILPKSYRKKNKNNISYSEFIQYSNLLNVQLSSEYEKREVDLIFYKDEDILSKINKKYEENEKLQNLNNILTPFCKRILYLKYEFDPNKIMSNAHISKLMCCSEEQIRLKLQEIKNKF